MAGAPARFGVACSGGPDSLALLHVALAQAESLGLAVVALHVNHGLMPEARRWEDALRRRCARWRLRGRPVAFVATRLEGPPPPGESVEAWARDRRYRALATMAAAAGVDLVLLAQHRRDQAETFLLQALRGGGAAGLAGMARRFESAGVLFVRPWLAQPRSAIEAYLRRHRLQPVIDDSNRDPALGRGRLRAAPWAPLMAAFPDAEKTLAAAARRAAAEAAALDTWARRDLQAVTRADGALDVAAFDALEPTLREPVLRAWLSGLQATRGATALVERLLAELPQSRHGRWPAGGGAELRLYRGVLRWRAPALPAGPGVIAPGTPGAVTLDLSRPGRYRLAAWRGAWVVSASAGTGLDAAALRRAVCRARSGGERWQAGPGRPPRSLRKQFQAAGIPEEARHGPLVWDGDRLLAVAGLGADARAADAVPGLRLVWEPDPA